MHRGPDAVKLELWRRRFREFERGTESVAAFCRQVGVSAATFYLWRRRVAAQTVEPRLPKSPRHDHTKRSQSSVPPLSFLPVEVTGLSPSRVEVVRIDGTRVLVPRGDRESLQLVLEVIAGTTKPAGAREPATC
jgi:hypothetical protein